MTLLSLFSATGVIENRLGRNARDYYLTFLTHKRITDKLLNYRKSLNMLRLFFADIGVSIVFALTVAKENHTRNKF